MEAYRTMTKTGTAYARIINEILAQWMPDNEEKNTLLDSISVIDNMFLDNHNEPVDLRNWFEMDGYGSYKYVHYLSKHFVLKFGVSNSGSSYITGQEADLYRNLIESWDRFRLILPDTYYLPIYLDDGFISSDCMAEEDTCWSVDDPEQNGPFNWIIVQQMADELAHGNSDPDETWLFGDGAGNEKPDGVERVVTWDEMQDSRVLDVEWAEDFVEWYGRDSWLKFIDFVQLHGLTDFHTDNIGYIKKRPVIIDWCTTDSLE